MAEESERNIDRLIALATQRFGPLSDKEKQVLHDSSGSNCITCELIPLGAGSPDNPAKADGSWPRERQVRAALIRWLCLAPEARKNISPRGIQVVGANVTDELDLFGMSIPFALGFLKCRLPPLNSAAQDP